MAKLKAAYPDAYKNNPLSKEIDANIKWMEEFNNNGLASANENIHSFFDDIVDKTNITDIESKISKSKDSKQTTANICKLIKQEELKQIELDYIRDYQLALKAKDLKKASEAMQCIKQARYQLKDDDLKEKALLTWKLDIDNSNIFKIQKEKIQPYLLIQTLVN